MMTKFPVMGYSMCQRRRKSFREDYTSGRRYGIGALKQETNKPEVEYRDACSEEEEGAIPSVNDTISDNELNILGPKVTRKFVKVLCVFSEIIYLYQKPKARITRATKTILFSCSIIRLENLSPFNPEKQYRFPMSAINRRITSMDFTSPECI
ncbi:MAG: hypothetical protein ACLU30_16980 [Odoribacter splanchnicus]